MPLLHILVSVYIKHITSGVVGKHLSNSNGQGTAKGSSADIREPNLDQMRTRMYDRNKNRSTTL